LQIHLRVLNHKGREEHRELCDSDM
jgi:hypothetical protein